MDHKAFLQSLTDADKATLTRRNNMAGLRHLGLHFGLIGLLGLLITAGAPFWWILLVPQGLLIAFLFTLQHEATHKTPFESEALNEWIGWATGMLIFQPFLWFRYFHLMHHKYTNIPDRDPELAGGEKPDNWREMAWHLSTFGYWKDKASVLFQLAFGRLEAAYLPERARQRLRTEARGMLGIYGAALFVTVFVSPFLIWIWIVPLLLGLPFLRLYLLAEHGRCPQVANMFDNTRTTFTNRIVRFLAWNMPYHVEHHVFPQVPFHLLPTFHDHIRNHLKVTSAGYVDFAQDYVSHFTDET